MALRFFLDEHLRGPLWNAIQGHNAIGIDVLDVVRVGDAAAPPRSTADPDLILWGEANGRVLITSDQSTVPDHVADHIHAGHHIAGVLILKPRWKVRAVVDLLVLYHQLCEPVDMIDRMDRIP